MDKRERFYAGKRAISAWHRWTAVFGVNGSHYESMLEFATWTGDPLPTSEITREIIINVENPEVMKKVEIILGPNGYTMLKMWKAQQDG